MRFGTNSKISPADKADIIELSQKIESFRKGEIDEERFKLYRLTRGVYGQRQLGVQMFRIKIPLGRLNPDQLIQIANISDKYATGNLHLTTRQDIQLHYVKLDDTPKVWAELAEKNITAREACGNTVRNVTASAEAGIDPEEPFDISPFAYRLAHYFIRNPICQEMGRKIKISFSSSEKDSALGFMHDFGFVPHIKDGQKGFRLFLGGGLGAQAIEAQLASEFIPETHFLQFVSAALRVFDRYGEREKRHKARLKFLIQNLGIENFLELVQSEIQAVPYPELNELPILDDSSIPDYFKPKVTEPLDAEKYALWSKTNVIDQKQDPYKAVYVKILLGDLSSERARYLASIVRKYSSDDIRITINQNFLLKNIHPDHLPELFTILDGFGFAEPGYDSTGDITACPGTDTCNLGVTNSTAITVVLEKLIKDEYPELLEEKYLKIKISGCMNACGQHMIAQIGLHGSSIKRGEYVIPSMQIVLGGGLSPDGQPRIADKVIKLPTRRIPDAVRMLIDKFYEESMEGEYFTHFYERTGGRRAYYDLLKPLADVENISPYELMDWGQEHDYEQAIGVGECAGVILDVLGTILKDAIEKLELAKTSFIDGRYADSVYHSYSSFIVGAKAMLLKEDISCNTHYKIVEDFVSEIQSKALIELPWSFDIQVFSIQSKVPDKQFASEYYAAAELFLSQVLKKHRPEASEKLVVESYYKA